MSDAQHAWQRQPGEPHLWFQRFERFRRMRPKRSLLGAYNREVAERGGKRRNRVPNSWEQAAKKWAWRERAEAWDAYQSEREEQEWESRRRQLRDQEWGMAQSLGDKARQMLVFPLARTSREEKSEDGGTVTVTTINPTKWSMRDAALISKTASELARLAAGLETGKVSLDLAWREEARKAGLDPDAEFDELVKTLLAKMGQRAATGGDPGGGPPAGGTDAGAPGGEPEASPVAAVPPDGQ